MNEDDNENDPEDNPNASFINFNTACIDEHSHWKVVKSYEEDRGTEAYYQSNSHNCKG